MNWVPLMRGSRQQAFIDLARKAVALQPDVLSTQEALGSLLLATGQYDEAVEALSKAIIRLPGEPKLQLLLADAYSQKGEPALARSIVQQISILEEEGSHVSIDRLTLGLRVLNRLKAYDEAAELAKELLQSDPANDPALRYLANYFRARGKLETLMELCRAALAHQPGHTTAYYELALTLALTGRPDQARDMMDLNGFVRILDLETPCGYPDAVTFQSALAAEIAADETLKPDPTGTATEKGFHTDFYLPHNDGQTSIGDLISLIQSHVDCVVADMTGGPGSPFLERRPQRARLNAWAVVHPSNGRQAPHIHPEGWLSGVYYVSAPNEIVRGAPAGHLVLGPVDEELNLDPPWGIREICPARGRLVLFPSYIPHATIPSGSKSPRICVAFDVIPCA